MNSSVPHLMLVMAMACLIQCMSAENDYPCNKNNTYIPGSSIQACFAVLDVHEGPVNASYALQKCKSKWSHSELAYPFTKDELKFVVDFAISQGVPTDDGQAGFWTVWNRVEDARLDSNGVLSQSNEDTRKNPNLFKFFPTHKSFVMPFGLWRNESQPGNTLDARDEKCTAQSRLGKQPEYLGLDDYECDGAQLHYTVCKMQ